MDISDLKGSFSPSQNQIYLLKEATMRLPKTISHRLSDAGLALQNSIEFPQSPGERDG